MLNKNYKISHGLPNVFLNPLRRKKYVELKTYTKHKQIEQKFKTYKNNYLNYLELASLIITISISSRTDLTCLKHGRILGT